MQLSHTRPVTAAEVRRPQPRVHRRAWSRSWRWLSDPGCSPWPTEHLSVPTDKGANAGRKIGSLVAGMVAGADSIADMAILRTERWEPSSTARTHRRPSDRFSGRSLRSRPPTRRRRLPVVVRTRRAHPGGHRNRHRTGAGRHRRFDHRSPRAQQTRIRIRLLRGPRLELTDHHRHHRHCRTGDHRAAPAQRCLRILPRRSANDRRHPRHRRATARRSDDGQHRIETTEPYGSARCTAAGAGRFGVLRVPRPSELRSAAARTSRSPPA